jgi:hypothetical protein
VPIDRSSSLIPLWIKVLYSAFVLILVLVYWHFYGPTNFLYFCDIALLLTLVGMWKESSLLVSMAAVGIVIPQIFWCVDFVWEISGHHLSGMTSYMFHTKPVYLPALSLFHGWLPFLLLWLVRRLGYDRRALLSWAALAWTLCLVAYFFLPPAGAALADNNLPRNVNYVFGLDDAQPQHWLSAGSYLLVWMATLAVVLWLPAHAILRKWGRVALS